MESRLPFKIFSTLNNFLMLIILTQKFAFLHMMNYYFCSPPKLLTKWQVPSATFLWYVFKSIYHVLSTYLSFRKYYWICVLPATTLRQYHELIWKIKRIEKVLNLELVSKELNHLVAILHVYAGVWILWSIFFFFFKMKMEILLHFKSFL